MFAQSGKSEVKITLEVDGSLISMEVDTRATMTVIPISVYKQYLSHVQLHASRETLKTYYGESLKVKEEVTVPVRLVSHKYVCYSFSWDSVCFHVLAKP